MIAPATVALSRELQVPIKEIAQLSGYQLLIVGALGPFVSCLGQKYGKRPQFLVAVLFGALGTAICIAGFRQSSLSKSYQVLLAGRMVQGIGTTAFESLSVAAVGDLFFLHERGLRTALLVLTLACLSSFVAVIAGTGFEHLGARNLFVMLLPIQIFAGLGIFFFLPETQFRRCQGESGGAGVRARVVVASRDGESVVTETEKEEAKGTESDVVCQRSSRSLSAATTPSGLTTQKRTIIQDLRVLSGIYSEDSLWKLLAGVFVHLLNPAVMWIMVVSAVLVSFFVGTAYTLAQTFSPPPYLLTVSQNGYFFTGALVGGILGVAAGPLCDFTAKYLARRNGGVYEAEFRIPVCALAASVFAVGWFTFGWALDNPGEGVSGARGTVILCSFCYGAICFGTSVASTSGGLYILDAFKNYSTEIFILQMMIKNFLFYAFSTFINDFAAEKGPGHMCRIFGIVTMVGFLTCIPMYIFGKRNRVLMNGYCKTYWSGVIW